MSDTEKGNGQQTNGENAPLFQDFPVPSYEEWRQVTEKSLKGGSFEKKLITRTYEGINLQPMYRQEDAADLEHAKTLPGFAPYVRSTRAAGYLANPWDIAQELPYPTPKLFNEALRYDLERGQTSAVLRLDRPSFVGQDPDQAQEGEVGRDGVSIASVADLAEALDGLDLEQIPLIIHAPVVGLPIAALLAGLAKQQGKALDKLNVWIETDPLSALARYGEIPMSIEQAYDEMASLTAWAAQNAPAMRTIGVHTNPYHNSGCNAVQELAFALATGVSYIRALQERGLDIDAIATRMRFSFAVGTNLFMEIGKLRAARILWSQVVGAFGGGEEAQKMVMHARTSHFNKTEYDPYVNMLRTTVEAFGGAIGGTDSMHVGQFDEIFREPDVFSRRIARNTHLILQEECHFMRLIDPAGGSWYIETLTDTLAREAWKQFQEIEKQGGMLQALQAGTPQEQTDAIAKERAKALATRRDVLVGTNMYPNLYEKKLDKRQPDYAAAYKERSAAVKRGAASDALAAVGSASGAARVEAAVAAAQAGATLNELTTSLRAGGSTSLSVKPLRVHRGSEMFEALRKNAEAYKESTGKLPQVFLANMGPIVQHKARADFATGFLEVSSFEMIRPNGFATPDEAAKAAIDSGARIVVICSTDDTYPDIVPPLTQALKAADSGIQVIVAGYPQDHVESFKAAGVDDFIHLRANCYQMNVQLQQKIGVSA